MIRVAFVALYFAVSSAQWNGFQNGVHCRKYSSSDCTDIQQYGSDKKCGSNGITYYNMCDFTQAKCIGIHVDLAHNGACGSKNHTEPPILTGGQAILDFFCIELSHERCPDEVEHLCGTDGVSYKNFCEFEKGRCTHRDLHVRGFGPCA